MNYEISSISNRNAQLLYQYRILRQPSDFMEAVFHNGEGVDVEFEFEDTTEAIVTTTVPENFVPILEFKSENWEDLEDLTELIVTGNQLILMSSTARTVNLPVTIHWCEKLSDFTQKILNILHEINEIKDNVEKLREYVENLEIKGGIEAPHGVPDNLVAIDKSDTGVYSLKDSLYAVSTSPEAQTLLNPSQERLASFIKCLSEPLRIQITDGDSRVLENFYGNDITIVGNGTWVFTNVRSNIIISDFEGSIIANDCSHVRTWGDDNRIQSLGLTLTYFTHRVGTIKAVKLARNSQLKHMVGGKIEELQQVGIACTYYGQTAVEDIPKYSWDTIQGIAIFPNGDIILNGFDLTFVAGNTDIPFFPTEIEYTPTPSPTPTPTPTPTYSDWVWSGDSRTVQMRTYCGVETVASKGAEGLSYLREHLGEIYALKNKNLFLWWGVNDLSNVREYAVTYNLIYTTLKDKCSIFVGTVGFCPNGTGSGRVDGGAGQALGPFNDAIDEFNTKLVPLLSSGITVIPVNDFIHELVDEHGAAWATQDNLHYTDAASHAICEYVESFVPHSDPSELIIEEDSFAAIAWNWFVRAGISGVSDKPEVIAGILGNFMQETGGGTYNFEVMGYGNGFYGMWCESNAGLRTAIRDAGLGDLWYPYFNRNLSFDVERQGVAVQLQWLTTGSTESWVNFFMSNVANVTNQTGVAGARAYAELFCVCVERCVYGSDSVEDPGVYRAMTRYYGGTVYQYQQLNTRRNYAERVYNEFYANRS